jgi:hypothetical protein
VTKGKLKFVKRGPGENDLELMVLTPQDWDEAEKDPAYPTASKAGRIGMASAAFLVRLAAEQQASPEALRNTAKRHELVEEVARVISLRKERGESKKGAGTISGRRSPFADDLIP